MEKFDFEEESAERHGPRLNILDLLTALVLVVALLIAAYVGYVFVMPNTPLNPLQPHIATPFRFPTATITPLQLEATWTATVVDQTATSTLAPTITLQPSPTVFSLVPPTRTPLPSATARAPFSTNVTPIESVLIHPDLGCGWFGIGGTVKDANNADMVGMVLRLSGTLNGGVVEKLAVSGTALDYGQSGFEFQLGTKPVASNKLLTLQLLDQGGHPQADNVYIITYNDCKKNLILVRFKKNG
jgi:hypothetical protein